MRIIQTNHPKEIKKIMQDIGVDAYGIKIMLPKATTRIVKINSLSNIAANILKQEMLSLGGDVAVARGALTGKTKSTDCLVMASVAQYCSLGEKLKKQPFGLANLSRDLSLAMANYEKEKFSLDAGRYKISLGNGVTRIMGVVNLTPDSFSGDGICDLPIANIIDFVERMIRDGANIIDIGGESSKPGARPVTIKEEVARVIPVIKAINKRFKVPISTDTYKPEVARRALDSGAVIINDITGLRNQEMIKLVSRYRAGIIIMHMKGNSPRVMQNKPNYCSLIDEIIGYLGQAVERAEAAGVKKDKIIIDPGLGFGKTAEHNLEILRRLKDFKVLGKPLLIGSSRKSFIGKILKAEPQERLSGSLSACVLAAQNGAHIVRVHDVKAVKQALAVCTAINKI